MLKRALLLILLLGAHLGSPLAHADEDSDRRIDALSPDEKLLLHAKPIASEDLKLAAIVNGGLGFGVGHSFVGLYRDFGWFYTATDTAMVGTIIAGFCVPNTTVALVGVIGLVGSHIAEVIDVLVRSSLHNDRRERVMQKVWGPESSSHWELAPVLASDRLGMGFRYRF